MAKSDPQIRNELVLSFLHVRRAVGILGIMMPVLLAAMSLNDSVRFVPSISEFYYTPAREVLVATVGAMAIFLFTYKGYEVDAVRAQDSWWEHYVTDARVGRAAAIGALLVAFCPTATDILPSMGPINDHIEPDAFMLTAFCQSTVVFLHQAGAGLLYVALATMSISNFRRGEEKTEDDVKENRLHLRMGRLVLLMLVAIAICTYFRYQQEADPYYHIKQLVNDFRLIFIFEAIGLFAFSISWLVKGRTLTPAINILGR